jgi:arginyl-tRNA synthetase
MSFKKFINEANEAIKFALKHLDIQNEGYTLTEPTKENFGDLSCNAAFLLTKRLQKSPSEIASILAEQCRCYIDAIRNKITVVRFIRRCT